MKTTKCPVCGKGDVIEEVTPRHETRFGGVPVVVEDAHIDKCSNCGETFVSAKEMERWRAVQRIQLQEAGQVPSAEEVTRIREALGLTVSDFAALLGVSRQSVHAWERKGGGGMAFGPASLLVDLLAAQLKGGLPGVCGALAQAARSRGQEVKSAERSRLCRSLSKKPAPEDCVPVDTARGNRT